MYEKILVLFLVLHYTRSALIELSCSDINTLISGHNGVRILVADGNVEGLPPAAEMNSVVWDEELAAKAEKWAASYPKSVDPDQTIPSHRFSVSQSISVFLSKDLNFRMDIEELPIMWFNEHENYTYGPITEENMSPSHPPVGDFTQMIWSDSVYLGCAMSENIEDELKKIYIVCEYGPSANVVGQLPYKAGKASNKLICATDENRCENPTAKKCYE
ncbi:venom allergen 5-like [Danaus plexippus]|uniref:venom allergen 5-like n=1 Tax=Danaus plexippus TaxID=13037 RepID=UPI002AAF728F|nr:venom allergen 5-like [Danaus plexippus]